MRRLIAVRPAAWSILGLGLAVFVTAWAGIEFTRHTGRVAAIWPANAILLTFLLRSQRPFWPWYVASGYAATVAADFLAGDAPTVALLFPACNTVEVLLAAIPLCRWWGPGIDLSRPATLATFVALAVILGPAVSATLAAAGLGALQSASFLETWRVWFLADSLGMMVFAPLLLTLPRTNPLGSLDGRMVVRAGTVLAAGAVVTGLVFSQESYPLLSLALPPLVWAAFVLGSAGTAVAIALATAIAIGMTVAGHGPLYLVDVSLPERIFLLQAFLAIAVLVALPLATVLAERRRLVEALRESEARYRLLADNSSDLIVLKETFDGVRRYVSPACRAILGYEPDQMAPSRPSELVHPDDLGVLSDLYGSLTPASPQAACTFRLRHRDSRWVWMEFVYKLTADPETGVPVVVGTGRDVTQRKEAEAALAAAVNEAQAAARAKSSFLAAMSHEIRTPLTAVIGMADLLAAKALDIDSQRYVAAIRGAGRQLLLVVNDILDFQHLGAGKMRLDARDFELAAVLEEVASVLRPSAIEKGLELTLCSPPGLGALRGDPMRLRQILFNVIGNAIKFTERGTVAVRCAASDGADGQVALTVEVQDSGVGIEPSLLAGLFQPFTQGDDTARRRFGGTGLGLAISRQLVELMGGRIGCRIRPGEGSTFWFEVDLPRGAALSVPRTSAPPPAIRPLELLLAEDAPLNRQLLAELLGQQGHRLTMSKNGADFLERAGERRFDVLLVDIQMPVLDGEEAIRRLRRDHGPNRETPAMALTANVMEQDGARYLSAGFDEVLHKPLALPDLLDALARLADPARRTATAPCGSIDWSFVAAAFGSLPKAAASDFLAQAVADARAGLSELLAIASSSAAGACLAHRLKGTARSFGLVDLGDAAQAIEEAAEAGLDYAPGLARYAAAIDATAGQLAELQAVA